MWEGADECFRAEVGKPIGFFYGYKSNGIFQNQEQIDNYKGAKINGDATQPGDVIWCDINNDNKIDENDRTEIGNPHPDSHRNLCRGLRLLRGERSLQTSAQQGFRTKIQAEISSSSFSFFLIPILYRIYIYKGNTL